MKSIAILSLIVILSYFHVEAGRIKTYYFTTASSVPRSEKEASQSLFSSFELQRQADPSKAPEATTSGPIQLRGFIPINEFTSGNIVENTNAQASKTLDLLKSWEGSDVAAQYIDPIFETSNCLNSISDAIELIEAGRKIVAVNGPEIVYLEALMKEMSNNRKDITKLLQGSSKMLKTLDGLTRNLETQSNSVCLTSPESTVVAFEDLARALRSMSNNRNLDVPTTAKGYFDYSANVMGETANFIRALNSATNTFKSDCKNDNKNHLAVYTSMEDIMVSLGKLFTSMGLDEKAFAVNEEAKFLNNLAVAFDDAGDFNLSLECEFVPRSYKALAILLDDMAELIDSIGLDSLSEDLGINFNLV